MALHYATLLPSGKFIYVIFACLNISDLIIEVQGKWQQFSENDAEHIAIYTSELIKMVRDRHLILNLSEGNMWIVSENLMKFTIWTVHQVDKLKGHTSFNNYFAVRCWVHTITQSTSCMCFPHIEFRLVSSSIFCMVLLDLSLRIPISLLDDVTLCSLLQRQWCPSGDICHMAPIFQAWILQLQKHLLSY